MRNLPRAYLRLACLHVPWLLGKHRLPALQDSVAKQGRAKCQVRQL